MTWHLYCDEAGRFEKLDGWKKSILFGMLVPDREKDRLASAYTALCSKHGFADFRIHGKNVHKLPQYQAFSTELLDILPDYPLRLFRMTYDEDIVSADGDKNAEAFACNRYLYMMQGLLEHVLFLHPEDYGQDTLWSLHPNNRVFPCRKTNLTWINDLGFESFTPKNSSDPGLLLVHVWDETGLRVFLNRVQMSYHPFVSQTGKREIEKLELPVADRSSDPLLHMVDNLAGLIMWNRPLGNRLSALLHMDFVYGTEEQIFRGLCRSWLRGDFRGFIVQYLNKIREFGNHYYRKQLGILMDDTRQKIGTHSWEQIVEIEKLADENLRHSSGNWELVSGIVDSLFAAVKNMPQEEQEKDAVKQLRLRLCNHKVSCHNHRGEIIPAWETVQLADSIAAVPRTMDEWRADADFRNRQAVSMANVFAFEQSNAKLLPLIRQLEEMTAQTRQITGLDLKDPLTGKLKGTMAQNYAFMAPFHPEFFSKAEEIFLEARKEFHKSGDTLRQNTYLFHLYLDQGNREKTAGIMAEIMAYTGVRKFLDHPGKDTAKSMSFTLSAMLKYWVETAGEAKEILCIFPLSALRECFGSAFGEHPFEFVCAYLGRLAMRAGQKKEGEEYFTTALSIPAKNADLQVTIQAVHAEILIWWALELHAQGENAPEKAVQALEIMTRIGSNPKLKPMLEIRNGKAVSGWFAKGYEPLKRLVKSGKSDTKGCEEFLRCFTFNYR